MSIEYVKYHGYDAVELSFNKYKSSILYGRGCNIIEFKDISRNLSFLHFPESGEEEEFLRSPQRFGSAILFPPNKIAGGTFTRNNIRYSFSEHNIPVSHGLLKEFPFELIDSHATDSSVSVKFRYNSQNDIYDTAFNWLFECFFEFELSDNGLVQIISFQNNGSAPIPLGIGFHTAFRIPENDMYQKKDYTIRISTGEQWELDSHSCPTGKLIQVSQDYRTGNILPLDRPISEHTQAAPLENGFNGAIITNNSTGNQFVYESDLIFRHWMIWNNKASDNYICIEPMSWIINAPNTDIPDELSGFTFLEQNSVWQAKNRMYIK